MENKFLSANSSPAIILVRLILAFVFISEGIQKFLFPDALGIGRFIKIGIPAPQIIGPFVGVVEIVCGCLVLVGLFSRFAAIPLIIDMIVAISVTKIPMLFKDGIWTMLHESRIDFSMFLGSIFILIMGAGKFSLDHLIFKKF